MFSGLTSDGVALEMMVCILVTERLWFGLMAHISMIATELMPEGVTRLSMAH